MYQLILAHVLQQLLILMDGRTGSETVTFRATDPGGLWDGDSATFTVIGISP